MARPSLRRVDLTSGRPEKQRALDPRTSAKASRSSAGSLYQLTWQNGVVVVYDLETFEVERTMQYDGEGWGLTHDGRAAHHERRLGDDSFPRSADVRRDARDRGARRAASRSPKFNELEYVDGEIWANIWYDDRIARISPANGEVLGFIDLATLYPRSARGSEAVLNGIAYDAGAKRLFVTGKNWPQLYEIELVAN